MVDGPPMVRVNTELMPVITLYGVAVAVAVPVAVADGVAVTVNTTLTVQVGAMQALNMPAGEIERVGISTLQGNDTINVGIFDTVNASLFVDGGQPTTVNKGNDTINFRDLSAGRKGTYSNISGGSAEGAGAVVLSFKAAGRSTRVDYVGIEKQTRR